MTDRKRKPIDPNIGPVCLAPPLTPEKLTAYKSLADALDNGPIQDGMIQLCEMVSVFQETPESAEDGVPINLRLANGKQLKAVPLTQEEVERIWDYVPWNHELDALGELFDSLDPVSQKPLRDAAFHLLWFGRELLLDREPMTQDLLA